MMIFLYVRFRIPNHVLLFHEGSLILASNVITAIPSSILFLKNLGKTLYDAD